MLLQVSGKGKYLFSRLGGLGWFVVNTLTSLNCSSGSGFDSHTALWVRLQTHTRPLRFSLDTLASFLHPTIANLPISLPLIYCVISRATINISDDYFTKQMNMQQYFGEKNLNFFGEKLGNDTVCHKMVYHYVIFVIFPRCIAMYTFSPVTIFG